MKKRELKKIARRCVTSSERWVQILLHSKLGLLAIASVVIFTAIAQANIQAPSTIVSTPVVAHDIIFSEEEDYPVAAVPASVGEKYKAELECMAKNIYFEARDQELRGKIAVGLVTLNRVNSTRFPNSICEVVWQKRWSKERGKWVPQFSWTLDGKSDVPREDEAFQEAERIAIALLEGGIEDFTNGADHYHADYVTPKWAKTLNFVSQIDDHLFYQE